MKLFQHELDILFISDDKAIIDILGLYMMRKIEERAKEIHFIWHIKHIDEVHLDNAEEFKKYDVIVFYNMNMHPLCGCEILEYFIANDIHVPVLFCSLGLDRERIKRIIPALPYCVQFDKLNWHRTDFFVDRIREIIAKYPAL